MKSIGIKGALLTSALSMCLTACGDDVTEITQSGVETVASIKDVKCTADNEGETLFASDDGAMYVCSKKEWINVSGVKNSECTAGKVGTDSVYVQCGDMVSGMKIPGAKDGSACEVEKVDKEFVYFKCGKTETKVPISGVSAEDESLKEQLEKIYNIQIKYMSYVFIRNSENLNELYFDDIQMSSMPSMQAWIEELDPKTLRPTGKMFAIRGGSSLEGTLRYMLHYTANAEVKNLISPVVRIRVELDAFDYKLGNYGNTTTMPRQSYYAITNLEKDKVVFASSASDLKAARIQALVESGKTYEAADKQANEEVLLAYGIDFWEDVDFSSVGRIETFDFVKVDDECFAFEKEEDIWACQDKWAVDNHYGYVFATMYDSYGLQDWESARRVFAKKGDFSEPYMSVENGIKELFLDKFTYESGIQKTFTNIIGYSYFMLKTPEGEEFKCKDPDADGGKIARVANKDSRHYGLWFECSVQEISNDEKYVMVRSLPMQQVLGIVGECDDDRDGETYRLGEYVLTCSENEWETGSIYD